MTRVDAEGRFVFSDLPSGIYNVFAYAPGYVDESLRRADMFQLPRHLLGAEVSIRMVKAGVITGTVTNHKGEPIVGVNVRASVIGEQRDLLPMFTGEIGQVETDDRGIYRIYGLPEGEYVVAAGGRGPYGPFTTGFDLDAPTYYPSSTRDTALSVAVRSGEEATGIDIRYRNAQGHTISGVVRHQPTGNDNINITSVTLFDVKTNTLAAVATSNVAGPTRPFQFDGLPDGEYDLLATFFSQLESNWSIGSKRVTVRGGDVTGVEISLLVLSSLEGAITLLPVEKKCDPRDSQLSEMVVNATNESTRKTGMRRLRSMYGLNGYITPDSKFVIRNLEPGRFRFGILLPTESWYVRDIQMPASASKPAGPQSESPKAGAWQGTGLIKQGENIKNVVISIGQDAAGLRGSVTLPKGMSSVPEGLEVHLVPVDREQADNVLRYYHSNVDSEGQFSFSQVAPGSYFSIAQVKETQQKTEPERPAAWDPVQRAELRRKAETIKNEIQLKACQKISDYKLEMLLRAIGPTQKPPTPKP